MLKPEDERVRHAPLKQSWAFQRWCYTRSHREGAVESQNKVVMLKRWFEFLDTDGSGGLDIDELENPLISSGLATSREEVEEMIARVDPHGRGDISFDQFLTLMSPRDQAAEPHKSSSPTASPSARKGKTTKHLRTKGPKQGGGGAPSAKANHEGSKEAGTPSGTHQPLQGNLLLTLLNDLNSGKLGSTLLPFSLLITAYRRKLILGACLREGKDVWYVLG